MLYEKRILNGEEIVVVYKPEGVINAKKEHPNTPIYSIREIEAVEGLEVLEQKMLQQAKQIFGGAIFNEKTFKQFYPRGKWYGKK